MAAKHPIDPTRPPQSQIVMSSRDEPEGLAKRASEQESMEQLADRIVEDARRDSLHYVLRSDVGQHGE